MDGEERGREEKAEKKRMRGHWTRSEVRSPHLVIITRQPHASPPRPSRRPLRSRRRRQSQARRFGSRW